MWSPICSDLRPKKTCSQPGHIPTHRRPLLAGLCARVLEIAYYDCQHSTNRTTVAHSLRFIRFRSDWTRVSLKKRLERWGSPGPSAEARAEFVLTHDYCCSVLNLDPEKTRRTGLPVTSKHSQLPHGGLSDWRKWRAARMAKKRLPKFAKKHEQKKAAIARRYLSFTLEQRHSRYVEYARLVGAPALNISQWAVLARI